jgi:metallo-beta-lactamase family protein
MMDKAFSESLLPKMLPDSTVHVFLVGWQDPLSPGGQLKSGASEVTVDGERIGVHAVVHRYECFSGHADESDIETWLARNAKAVRIALVHGEKEALEARRQALGERGWTDVTIATPGDPVVQLR